MPIVSEITYSKDDSRASIRYLDTDNGNAVVSEYSYNHTTGRITSGARADVVIAPDNILKSIGDLRDFRNELLDHFGGEGSDLSWFKVRDLDFKPQNGKINLKVDINGDTIINLERNTATGQITSFARVAIDFSRADFAQFQEWYARYAALLGLWMEANP